MCWCFVRLPGYRRHLVALSQIGGRGLRRGVPRISALLWFLVYLGNHTKSPDRLQARHKGACVTLGSKGGCARRSPHLRRTNVAEQRGRWPSRVTYSMITCPMPSMCICSYVCPGGTSMGSGVTIALSVYSSVGRKERVFVCVLCVSTCQWQITPSYPTLQNGQGSGMYKP